MSMNERVIACITKPPKDRSNEEIDVICPWLTMKTEIFKTTKPEIIKDIIRNCSYVKRYRDDVIIRQGDKGDCFYVILNGCVAIFINTEAVPEDPNEATVVGGDDTDDVKETKAGKTVKKELDRSKYGNCVAHFESGKSFGDLALINKDCVRNASIIADEETDLLEVNRDLFNRCLKAAAEAEFQERITFVNQCSLFSSWPSRFKRQAAMSLRKEFVAYNKPLVTQGEPTDGLKFILTGQAKVMIDSLMHFSQYPHLNLHEDPEDSSKKEMLDIMMELKLMTLEASATLQQQQQHSSADAHGRQKLWEKPVRRQGYLAAEQRQAMRHIEISLVGPGEVIGEIELSMGLSTYAQTILCIVETSIYVFDARNFERLVNARRNPKTLVMLKVRAEQKLLSRQNRVGSKQVPLIRCLLHRINEAREQEAQKEQRSHQQQQQQRQHRHHGRSSSVDPSLSDLLKRGPVIDFFGPGTVFYRNRKKRKAKFDEQRAKDLANHTLPVLPSSSGNNNNTTTNHSNNNSNNRAGVHTALSMLSIVSQTTDGAAPPPHLPAASVGDEESVYAGSTTTRSRHAGLSDWETGSEHLNNLEDRIRQWHMDMDAMLRARANSKKAIFGLKRFKAIAPAPPLRLRTGKKIVLRPRNTKGFNEFQMENWPERAPPSHLALESGVGGGGDMSSHLLEDLNSPTSKEVFVTSLKTKRGGEYGVRFHSDSSSESSDSDYSPPPLSPPVVGGGKLRFRSQGKSSTLNVIPLSEVQDGRNLPYQNLQPLFRSKKLNQSDGTGKVGFVTPDIKKLFSPAAKLDNNGKRASRASQANVMVAPSNQQYSMEEYNDLKKMLRKKELEMVSSRYSMAF